MTASQMSLCVMHWTFAIAMLPSSAPSTSRPSSSSRSPSSMPCHGSSSAHSLSSFLSSPPAPLSGCGPPAPNVAHLMGELRFHVAPLHPSEYKDRVPVLGSALCICVTGTWPLWIMVTVCHGPVSSGNSSPCCRYCTLIGVDPRAHEVVLLSGSSTACAPTKKSTDTCTAGRGRRRGCHGVHARPHAFKHPPHTRRPSQHRNL